MGVWDVGMAIRNDKVNIYIYLTFIRTHFLRVSVSYSSILQWLGDRVGER